MKNNVSSSIALIGDDYNIELSPVEKEVVARKLTALSIGPMAAIPLKCNPVDCPFRDTCPLVPMEKAPKGKSCLIESQLLRQWTERLIFEYEVSDDDITDQLLLGDLVETQLHLYRINSLLALPENAQLLMEEDVGVDKQGNPLRRKELNKLLDLSISLQRQKRQIIKMMVGDRQEKYKKQAALKEKSNADISVQSAAVRKQLEQTLTENKEQEEKKDDVLPEDLFSEGR